MLHKYAEQEKGETLVQYQKLEQELKQRLVRFEKQAKMSHSKEKQQLEQDKKNVSQMVKQQRENSSADEASDEKSSLLQQQKKTVARVADYAAEIEHNEMLIAERDEDIREIANSISEIQDVFRELNVMVHEQGETLDLIENNVEDAALHVHSGVDDLKTTNKLDKKSRNLMCIILVIVLVLGIAITIALLIVLKVLKIF